jgi:translation initiation factor 2D
MEALATSCRGETCVERTETRSAGLSWAVIGCIRLNMIFLSVACCCAVQAELRAACMRRCQLQVRLSRGPLQRVKKGSPPSVQISSERRQGNKHVTRIVGVEDFLLSAGAVASECQKKFACSTSVAELPGKNNPGFEVVIQGQVVDQVADHLVKTYGIPKQYILVKK